MTRRRYDPLDFVPSPEIVRQKLSETERLAERLRVLLELAERLRLPLTTGDHLPAHTTTEAKEGRHE
jgi:hypothetical protein